jgi:hypothetical protein
MMGGVSLETCWAIKKHWNNKFYYTVASCWFFLWENCIPCKLLFTITTTFTITLLQAMSQATTEATKAVISHSFTNPSGIMLYHISMQMLYMRVV